jgi:hypothetical protein
MATPCITGPEREVHIQNEAESCAKGVSCHSVLNGQAAEEVLLRHFHKSNAPDEHNMPVSSTNRSAESMLWR